ncbi:hypothetical protein MMC07_001050 [Pseudocyphellaria aurata]|nr:hypothetical protein [Pseudocyphellaria aurata]
MPERPPPSTAAIALATAILGGLVGYFFAQASSLGIFSSSSSSSSPKASKSSSAPKKSWPNSYDVTLHPDTSDEELMKGLRGDSGGGDESSDEETEDDGTGLKAFEGDREECKLVLVVRTDLGMQKGIAFHHFLPSFAPTILLLSGLTNFSAGKIAAQCSHATLSNYRLLLSQPHLSPLLRRWESTGQAKIALQAPSPPSGADAESINGGGEGELEKLRAQASQLGLCATIVHDAGRTQIAAGSATVLGVGPGPKSVVDRVTGGLKLL